MKDKTKGRSGRKLILSVATLLFLSLCLCISTYALSGSTSVSGNSFSTASVDVEVSELSALNVGELSQDNAQLTIEPGMRISKFFTVTNKSSCDIYYKLYLTDMEEELASAFNAKITDREGNTTFYEGRATDLTKDSRKGMSPEEWSLPTNDTDKQKEYILTLTFSENAGNEWKAAIPMDFKLEAAATQMKNNPDKEF